MLLITGEQRAVLLEPALHTVLNHVDEGLAREELWLPLDILLAPRDCQMRANHAPNLVPVLACQHLHTQHICHHHDLLKESHASLGLLNVHFGAGCDQDDCTDIVLQALLLLRQAVEHGVCALIVADVDDLLNVVVQLVVVVRVGQGLLDARDHGRNVTLTNLHKREVPVALRVLRRIETRVALAVAHSAIVGKPDIVPVLPKLDWHWEARVRIVLIEPGVCGHVDPVVQQDGLLNIARLHFRLGRHPILCLRFDPRLDRLLWHWQVLDLMNDGCRLLPA